MAADMAQRRQEQLDALPDDVGGRIRGLQEYDFLEPAARERFEALLDRLRKQVLDSMFQGLSEAIQNVTPEQLAANREMVRDLNKLLGDRLDGDEPSQDRVDAFLAQHGQFFPGAKTLDDIVEQLAERMAAMQSLLASMSPQQRDELQSMMDALLRDDRLRWDLAQLAATLDQLLPGGPRPADALPRRRATLPGRGTRADGAAPAHGPPLPAAPGRGRRRLAGGRRPDEVRDLLDAESAQDLEALQDLAKALEEAGYVERQGDRLELTPRGSRRLGQRVLDQLFAKLRKDAFGGHAMQRSGSGGERTEESTAWEFGRPFHLDLQRTLGNALGARGERAGAPPRGEGAARCRWTRRTSRSSRPRSCPDAATVLLVDMSRSMLLRGCFLAAKKVAVALDTLIRTQFPRDRLHVVGFAYYAREIRPEALAGAVMAGLRVRHQPPARPDARAPPAGARRTAPTSEVVVITDGEPTAHFEDGQVEFSYPPTRRTITETLKEVGRCTREGITINTFMLERSRALTEFVDRMTQLNRGRAFYASPEHLGEYVLVDYVGNVAHYATRFASGSTPWSSRGSRLFARGPTAPTAADREGPGARRPRQDLGSRLRTTPRHTPSSRRRVLHRRPGQPPRPPARTSTCCGPPSPRPRAGGRRAS